AFLALLDPADVDRTNRAIFDAFRSARPCTYDHRIIRPDGSVRLLRTRCDVVRDEHGKPLRMIGICWDITDLHDTTRKLEHSVSLLEATINATADGLLIVDRKGKVAAYNQGFLRLWGIPREVAERGDDAALLDFVVDQLEDAGEFRYGVQRLYGE